MTAGAVANDSNGQRRVAPVQMRNRSFALANHDGQRACDTGGEVEQLRVTDARATRVGG